MWEMELLPPEPEPEQPEENNNANNNNNNAARQEKFEDRESMILAEWLEEILKNYCKVKIQQQTQPALISTPVKDAEKFRFLITSIKFYKAAFANENASGSADKSENYMRISITFSTGPNTKEETEHLFAKLSSTTDNSQLNVYRRLNTHLREIDFYTKIAPGLEDWVKSIGAKVYLGVPLCYHGEYQKSSPTNKTSTKLPKYSAENVQPEAYESHSVLIWKDLEVLHGFKRKAPNMYLTLLKVRSALKEISLIHAVSWAQQYATKTLISKRWPILLNARQAAPFYIDKIQAGFPILIKLLTKHLTSEDGKNLITRLKVIEPKIAKLLYSLLDLPKFPSPCSIIHLDFQHQNLLFRDSINQSKSEPDCCITNWKYAAVGSSLHDVAFLLFVSMDPISREENTISLLQFYFKMFKENLKRFKVTAPFDFTSILDEYNKSFLLSCLLVIGNLTADDENIENVDSQSLDSFVAAVRELMKNNII